MPLGIVSDDDFDSELKNSLVEVEERGVSIGSVEIMERGRGKGNNAVPDSLQKIIGETAILEGRAEALDLANQFGVSSSSASAYTVGSASTASYKEGKKGLTDHLKFIRERATKKAGKKLLAALDQITDEKLEDAPAGVLAGMAKSLSGVIKDLEPENEKREEGSRVQFVVFAPQVKNESHFETIELKE